MTHTNKLSTIKKRLQSSVPDYKEKIAALTGVKFPTIFRVLNNHKSVLDSTRSRVIDASIQVLQRELNNFSRDMENILP